MSEGLINSRRELLQATHTPIASTREQRGGLRTLEKAAVVRSLRLTPKQLDDIASTDLLPAADVSALRTLSQRKPVDLEQQVEVAAALDPDSLVAVIDHLDATARAGASLPKDFDRPRLLALRGAARSFTQIEPVGYLHLEKLAFTPEDTEPGELAHSVPLAPKEVSSFTHREWSNVSEEFERLETDMLEEFSEQGVVEKNELQTATENQYQHSTELSAGVNISGKYGNVKFAATASASASDSASRSDRYSRELSSTVTRKAARRSVKEHKFSFRTVRTSGSEDTSVKRIANPHDYPIRVDYYRMMRKWSVDLLRYGVRLTYDLVVPEPGAELLSQIKEMQEIERMLAVGFPAAKTGPEWAQFPLVPSQLTAKNFAEEAAKFAAVAEPPPEDTKSISATNSHTFNSETESQRGAAASLDLDVDTAYDVIGARGSWTGWEWPRKMNEFARDRTSFDDAHVTGYTVGRSGRVSVPYGVRYAASYAVTATLDLKLTDAAFVAWQGKTWSVIRDAAERRYFQQRASLQERLRDLAKLLGQNDTLTLRRMEREEVMKAALRWLIGPSFSPTRPAGALYAMTEGTAGAVLDDNTWVAGTNRGNLIEFLQHAVEWENVLYLVYPYFWSDAGGTEVRKYLDHPDPTHRAFLRAGAARVVLTIRPGFEADFVNLLAGRVTGSSARYLTIAEEMQAFANTNYPGIRPANGVEDPRPLLTFGQRKTWEKIQAVQTLLDSYRKANGRYPTTAEGLQELAQTASGAGTVLDTTDFWGNELVYQAPGRYEEYDLSSPGADPAKGVEEETADITSWADSSLVAQWFEYTPTSALDIAVVQHKPEAKPDPGEAGDGEKPGSDDAQR